MRRLVCVAMMVATLSTVGTAVELPPDTKSIKTLTVEQARTLAAKKHRIMLDLSGLTALPPEVARELAHCDGTLYLGVTELSDESALALAMHEGDELNLRQMTRLSDKAAVALSIYEGDLSLNGVKTLSGKAAKAIAKREHDTELLGLAELSDEAATALERTNSFVYMRSTVRMSARAAAGLRRNSRIKWDQEIPILGF